MKFLYIFASMFTCIACLMFSGCNTNSNINRQPPPVSTQLLAPYATYFGTYLSWDEVQGADRYNVYCDGQLLGTTNQTSYIPSELDKDCQFYVVAENSISDIISANSNVVEVSKNCNFSTDEILDLTSSSYFASTISPSIRKVIIGNNSYSTFSLCAELAERKHDIIFELNNVTVSGSIVTANSSYRRSDNDYNVILNVNGECSINGINGQDGTDYSDPMFDNKEFDAGKGTDGRDAMIIPTAVITGNGNLTISGGNGGNGGKGSSTTTWESVNGPGAGADGGDGGAAIKTSYLIIDMQDYLCNVSIVDGSGGNKGTPGENNSIITGPVASLMWDDMYDIGKSGENGESIILTKKIFKGELLI